MSRVQEGLEGDLTVRYIYIEDGNEVELTDNATTTELVGTPYSTSEKEFYGYTLDHIEGNNIGNYSYDETVVTYVYTRNIGTVVVHHVEKDTNVNLANDVVMEGYVGTEYVTYEEDIEGYFLSSIEGEYSGEYTDETIVVTYIYEKIGQGSDNPPQTGIDVTCNNPYLFYILTSIVLLFTQLFRKKEKNN